MMVWYSITSVRKPSSSVGMPNWAGSGAGCWSDVFRELAAVAGDRNEVGHARAEPALLIGVADGAHRGLRVVLIGQDRAQRRLVGNQGPDVLRVRGDEGQRVDRATAAGEQVHRSTDLLDDPMQILGVLFGDRLGARIVLDAALRSARVVGHHGPVREVAGQRGEAGGPIGEPISISGGWLPSPPGRTS